MTKSKGIKTPNGTCPAFIDSVVAGTAPTEPNGCILWPFAVSMYGYAKVNLNGRTVHVGRVVLERTVGPPPSDQHTMGHAPHDICGHRRCVAPSHLAWQTHEEQIAQTWIDGRGVTGAAATNIQPQTVIDEALRRVNAGSSFAQTGRDLGVSGAAVRKWWWDAAPRRIGYQRSDLPSGIAYEVTCDGSPVGLVWQVNGRRGWKATGIDGVFPLRRHAAVALLSIREVPHRETCDLGDDCSCGVHRDVRPAREDDRAVVVDTKGGE